MKSIITLLRALLGIDSDDHSNPGPKSEPELQPKPEPEPTGPIKLGEDELCQRQHPHQTGIHLTVQRETDGLSARLSARTRRLETATLRRVQDGTRTVVGRVDIHDYRPGEWVVFDSVLEPGEYEIVVDSDGERFWRGKRSVDYPLENGILSVEHGIYGEVNYSDSYRYAFDELETGVTDHSRKWDATADIPDDVEIVDVDEVLDLEEDDVGGELQKWVDATHEINHVLVLPEMEGAWTTHLTVPQDAEFFGLVARGDGAHFNLTRSLKHPITIGKWGKGVGSALVRGITWDITGTDPDGWPLDTGFMQLFADDWFLVEDCGRVGQRQRYQWRDGVGEVDGYYRLGNAYGMLAAICSEDGFGIVESVHTDGGVHNTREPDDPVAERPGNPGEGIGFSGELNEGLIAYRNVTADRCVDNTFYMYDGNSRGRNVVEHCEVTDGSRCAVRLGDNDFARDVQIAFNDMSGRYPGSGLWMNGGDCRAEDIVVDSPDGNHELVRISSDCIRAMVNGLDIVAGENNAHHTLRVSGSGDPEDVVVRNFDIVDRSPNGTLSEYNSSVCCTRPMTLRNGTIDVSDCERLAIDGDSQPLLEDVEIVE